MCWTCMAPLTRPNTPSSPAAAARRPGRSDGNAAIAAPPAISATSAATACWPRPSPGCRWTSASSRACTRSTTVATVNTRRSVIVRGSGRRSPPRGARTRAGRASIPPVCPDSGISHSSFGSFAAAWYCTLRSSPLGLFGAAISSSGRGAILPTSVSRSGGGGSSPKTPRPTFLSTTPEALRTCSAAGKSWSNSSLYMRDPAPSETTARRSSVSAATSSISSPPTERPRPPMRSGSTSGRCCR